MNRMQEECSFYKLIKTIGKKYTLALLFVINKEGVCYNEIHDLSDRKINPTLLSKRLNEMMQLGLISKKIINERQKYYITEEGILIRKKLISLKEDVLLQKFIIPKLCNHKENNCLCDFNMALLNRKDS